MVLIPDWIVCFWPGSGPRPGEIWPGHGGQQLVTITFYFYIGEKKREKKELVSLRAFAEPLVNQYCHRAGRIQLAKPLSAHQHHCMTWEDSQTFFSQEISFLAQPVFKWVLCHFTVADSNPFGSETWLGCLEEGWGGGKNQIHPL